MNVRRIAGGLAAGMVAAGLLAGIGAGAQAAPPGQVTEVRQPVPDVYYEVYQPGSALCVTADGTGAAGSPVTGTACASANNQTWTFIELPERDYWGDNLYVLENRASHMCLELADTAGLGTPVVQSDCLRHDSQKWSLRRLGGGLLPSYQLMSFLFPTQCLNGPARAGAGLVLGDCPGRPARPDLWGLA